jgi:hypothetical protein
VYLLVNFVWAENPTISWNLSKNGCRKSGLLADPELNVTLLLIFLSIAWNDISVSSAAMTLSLADGTWSKLSKPIAFPKNTLYTFNIYT